MQTQGQSASNMWGGSANGLESNWGLSTPHSSGANVNMLGGLGGSAGGLSNNQGLMQSGASSAFGDMNTINSNPMLGKGGGWGAPGTVPPSQSKMSANSSGIMQGSLPTSGAQLNGPQTAGSIVNSQTAPGSQSATSVQGNIAFGGGNTGFQKLNPAITSSGLVMNPGTSIMNSSASGSSGPAGDASGWGVPSSLDNARVMGTSSWGMTAHTAGDWDQQSTSSLSQTPSQQSQLPPNSQFRNPNTAMPAQQSNPADQRPSSWAQAAGKGLNLNSNPQAPPSGPSHAELQRDSTIREAIENHDGWGKKPIRQDTQWSIETSPKLQRKFSTVVPEPQQQKGSNNMWNNNNGTAIWEANKEGTAAWNSSSAVARAPGPPNPTWPGGPPQKPPDPSGRGWSPSAPGQTVGVMPTTDKAIGSWDTDGNQSSSSGQNWSGSTETGSWGGQYAGSSAGAPASSNIPTWVEPEASAGWNGEPRQATNNSASYWGEPQAKPPAQQPPPPPQVQPPPQWNAAVMGPPPTQPSQRPNPIKVDAKPLTGPGSSGWGDPMGPPDPKNDDGTSLWAANSQQQARAAGWGDTASQGQWNSAIGKAKPPSQTPPNWGGVDDLNWNTPREDIWSEESMGGWDDADMGTWSDNAQQTNSSWNSATGFNKNRMANNMKQPNSAMKFPGVASHPPQMRSRLLQQMMDLGFKKDEAQHALITNNMNIQGALTDLYNRPGAIGVKPKDTDMDMFHVDGAKPRMPGLLSEAGNSDDISDTQSDSNSFVPNINSMQNTPFNNAQSQLPNQYPYKGPSLSQSSLTPGNAASINALQQKLMHKMHSQQQQPPPLPPQPSMPPSQPSLPPSQRGPMPGASQGGGGQSSAVQQQMAQQQILQQLRMAVHAGLISPQLLNQQLPGPVLVMLQQLLQQQQMLQQHITTKMMLQKPNVGAVVNPVMQRQQIDQETARINNIKQQILLLQKNISQAQTGLLKPQQSQPAHGSPDHAAGDNPTLLSDMSAITMASSQPKAESRLTQWKRTTPDKESPDVEAEQTQSTSEASDGDTLNRAVGSGNASKGVHQSQSTPNLRKYDDLGLSHLVGDSTWTPTTSAASRNWPNTSSGMGSDGDKPTAENKESQSNPLSSHSSLNLPDSIPEEFVPGKPWQGIATKNVDDDPHITPGSFSRSLSVNTIKDDYLLSLTKGSPATDSPTSSWPSKPVSSSQNFSNKTWSPGEIPPSSFSSEVWGVPMPKGGMSRPPPGLPQQQAKGGYSSNVNRQHSWAPNSTVSGSWDQGSVGSSTSIGGGSTSVGSGSTALILKNLTPQIDGSTLRTLCMQHGPLQCFYLNLAHGQALVKYSSCEEAAKAQKSLNTCLLGNTTIVADFVSDVEAIRFVEQQSAMSAPGQWSQVGGRQPAPSVAPALPPSRSQGLWNTAPPTSSSSSMWGNIGGGGSSGSSGALWDSLDDTQHNLLGNMLGETM